MVLIDRSWKPKVDIYHLIQQRCDRPAYFWFNFTIELKTKDAKIGPAGSIEEWSEPVGQHVTIPECLERFDFASFFKRTIESGEIDPQAWCDAN